jgi:hypothetical protein
MLQEWQINHLRYSLPDNALIYFLKDRMDFLREKSKEFPGIMRIVETVKCQGDKQI